MSRQFLVVVCFEGMIVKGIAMPDIAMRFNKDMLVLSTPIDYQLRAQGFNRPTDREYVALCEPELLEEAYRLERVLETPCFVTATEGITQARLAHANFDGQASEMAALAYQTMTEFTPQHLIASIGPTGLPLDPSSAASMKASRAQYEDAARQLIAFPFDALFLSGFANARDAQCALMGVRAIYDGPLMITLCANSEGMLDDQMTLAEAASLCDEYGADVIGVRSECSQEELVAMARILTTTTAKPLIFEIDVRFKGPSHPGAPRSGTWAYPDSLMEVALALRSAGVQFLRAVGQATPAYTGALLAAVTGHDVVGEWS